MSKSNYLENAILALLFNGTVISGIARQAASPPTNFYVSLHTANPTDAGSQNTNEATYTGYAREAVAWPAGWTVTGDSVSPAATIIFPVGSGGGGTVTHWGVGTDATGAGTLLYFGTVSPNIVTGAGITPKLSTATAITED